MAANKGGARRSSVPHVSLEALQSVIDKAVERKGRDAFMMGEYDQKKVSTAVSAKGIHQNVEYIREFYKISSGEILAGQLKQCILKYGHSHNDSEWKDDLWAGRIASQMVCLLSHVRRLKREEAKLRQCLLQATGSERQTVLELVDLQPDYKKAVPEAAEACKKALPSSSVALPARQSSTGSTSDADQQACKKARSLKPAISDVSVDSNGWPMMLKSPKRSKQEEEEAPPQIMSILEKRRASYKEQLNKAAQEAAEEFVKSRKWPERRPAKKPACKAGIQKKTAAKEKNAKREAAESSRLERKPATSASQEDMQAAARQRPGRRPWTAVKKILGKDQAYLMGLFDEKWKLIIGCTKKMGQFFPGGHHSVVLELEKCAMEESMTKEKVKQKRDDLVKEVD